MSNRSIPHASSHTTHQLLSTSPANSATSPVRESALAQSETTLPDDSEKPFPPYPAESVAPTPAPVAAAAQE
jgi:hypothetical protein